MTRRKRKLKEELRSFWFIPLRLSVFVIVFGAIVLTDGGVKDVLWPFLLYSLVTLLCLLVMEVETRLFRPGLLKITIFIQFAFELVVVGALIQNSGQLTSHFSVLFLLTIVSASLVYRLAGTLSIATVASFAFAFTSAAARMVVDDGLLGWRHFTEAFHNNDEVFYAVFLHVCTFYLVAFISGFLAQKLRAKEGELTQASQVLQRVQLDTDDILQNLTSGLITIDNAGKIIYFNRAAESILGLRQIDLKGKSFLDAFNKQMPDLCERILSVLKLARPNMRVEVEVTLRDGRRRPLGLSASVLGDPRFGIRGVIAIFQDLTLAKEMEEAFVKANRLAAVGELSARIAHEIRNPLASISGSVEVLKNEMDLRGDNARLMELIVKESERLSRILTDFLNYARTGPGRTTRVELVSIINETVDLLRNSLHVPSTVKIELKTLSGTEYIVGDEDQIKQLLINLITNAVEAVDLADGRIQISLTEPDSSSAFAPAEWLCVTVTDNGCGMEAEVRERLFEPFYSRKKGGTGLGLAVVKRCLDNMRGRIEVESSLGAGTKFTIHLRRYQATREEDLHVGTANPVVSARG